MAESGNEIQELAKRTEEEQRPKVDVANATAPWDYFFGPTPTPKTGLEDEDSISETEEDFLPPDLEDEDSISDKQKMIEREHLLYGRDASHDIEWGRRTRWKNNWIECETEAKLQVIKLQEKLSATDNNDAEIKWGSTRKSRKDLIQERTEAKRKWGSTRKWRKNLIQDMTEAKREELFQKELGRLRAMQLATQREMVMDLKKEMKQVLMLMDYLPRKISDLLSEPVTRPDKDHRLRRRLAFVKKELSVIVSALRLLAAPTAPWPEHCDPRIKPRLTHLRDLADWTGDLLHYGYPNRLAEEFPELNLAWIEQLLLADHTPSSPPRHPDGDVGSSTELVLLNNPALLCPLGDGKLNLVGIDGPRKKLLGWLQTATDGDASGLRIISIVGPAGAGKTTLAMDLLHQIGGQYFQCHAAAKMSQRSPGTSDLLKHIMSQIIDMAGLASSSEPSQSMLEGDQHELAYDLKKHLQDKRYLIVIDDLWRSSDWEIIRGAFPRNNCSSRIIITTRIRSVGLSCCFDKDGLFVHEVKPLSELDSKRLFLDAASGSHAGTCPSDNSSSLVFDEILRRCDGIPFFIIAMANLMRQEQAEAADKKAEAYWLERIPELKQVEEALSPSYYDLPQELKLLSLYMSTFPRGHQIDKQYLFRKWECEGLIPPDTGKAIEELADEHFSTLLDRYIIRPITGRDNSSEVESRWYHVNDFMLEFLSSISAQKNFLATSCTLKSAAAAEAEGSTDGDDKAWKLKRMSFHQPDAELPVILAGLDVSHTHSLTVSGLVNRIPLDKFVHLMVLSLEGWQNLEDDDLVQICNSNFRLKYLSIRNTRVSKLPPQITELSYLETLDISHTQIGELSSKLWELPELRVLDLRNTPIRMLPGPIRHRAARLQHLLVNGRDKVDLTVTEVPEDIVYCPHLETLETVDLSHCSVSFIENLARQESLGLELASGELNEITVEDPIRRNIQAKVPVKVLESLKVLAVTWSFHQCYDEKYQTALRSAIQKSHRLESLTIHCELGCSMEFLDSLPDTPPQSLKNICILGRFLTVPKWMQQLNNLAFLHITVCKLVPDDVKLLGAMLRLECLVLGLDFLPEEAIVIGCEGFSQLQRFSVDCRVPWLAFGRGSMPKLTGLDLRMTSADSAGQDSEPSGIANLLSLEQITLHYYQFYTNCRSVTAVVDAVRRQITELGYTVRLVINAVEDDVRRSCGGE